MQTPFVFLVLGLPCCFFLCRLVLLSSLLVSFIYLIPVACPVSVELLADTLFIFIKIIYARFTSHHRSVLMTHLYSLIANDIPPSVNKLPPLQSLLLFSVRRFYVISAAAMVFRSACPTLGQRTAGGPLSDQVPSPFSIIHSLSSSSLSNYLESTAFACHQHMTFLPAAGWWQKVHPERLLSSLTKGWTLLEGMIR